MTEAGGRLNTQKSALIGGGGNVLKIEQGTNERNILKLIHPTFDKCFIDMIIAKALQESKNRNFIRKPNTSLSNSVYIFLCCIFVYFRFRLFKIKSSDGNKHCVNLNSNALMKNSKVHPTLASSIKSLLKFNKQAKFVWDT